MRISDWSSDVCSSDLQQMQMAMSIYGYGRSLPYARKQESQADEMGLMLAAAACYNPEEATALWERMGQASGGQAPPEFALDRKNVVEGKRVAVSVGSGGSRNIKTKN